jgi:hypothetical protein
MNAGSRLTKPLSNIITRLKGTQQLRNQYRAYARDTKMSLKHVQYLLDAMYQNRGQDNHLSIKKLIQIKCVSFNPFRSSGFNTKPPFSFRLWCGPVVSSWNRQRFLNSASIWRGNLELGFPPVSLTTSHFVCCVALGGLWTCWFCAIDYFCFFCIVRWIFSRVKVIIL